jgi:hypothetical protein
MGYTHDKYVDALTQGSKFYGEIGDVPHYCHQDSWKKTRKMDGKQDL